MAPEKGGRVVFIGNIPYGVSEEQIIDIFSRVGAVNSFRLVHDKETGRPKGFGFLEFADPDNAAAAVRNLNDHDVMGRKLRVDWSNDSSGGGSGGGSGGDGAQNQPSQSNGLEAQTQSSTLPPLPPGMDMPGLSAPDAISKTLSAMPAPQLLDIISQMKGMVADNPAQVMQLFTVAPQLAYAIFQALLLLGLTDTAVLGSIVQQAANPQQAAPPPIPQPAQPQYPPQIHPAYPGYPPQQVHVPTPPAPQPAFAPPQPPVSAPPPDQQQELIAQVLRMSAEQIYALDPNARDQIIRLRAQLGAPVG